MLARLLLIFIGVPLVELFLFLHAGRLMGIAPTVALVILTGVLGAWLTKQQGLRTLRRYHQALAEGRLPHEEVIEGIMILAAGAVLLTPGFLTDVAGFLVLIPRVRAAARRKLAAHLEGKILAASSPAPGGPGAPGGVIEIEAEVIEETRDLR